VTGNKYFLFNLVAAGGGRNRGTGKGEKKGGKNTWSAADSEAQEAPFLSPPLKKKKEGREREGFGGGKEKKKKGRKRKEGLSSHVYDSSASSSATR